MRIERGDVFELCVDRSCEPMDAVLASHLDGEWSCPADDCEGELRVIRRRRLFLGCDQYPDCDTAFEFPTGMLDGHCGCGLPRFRDQGEVECLDASCTTG